MIRIIHFTQISLPTIFIFTGPPYYSRTKFPFFEAFYENLDKPRHPLSGITPSLPYPSDIYAVADHKSITGQRIHFPEGMIRKNLLDKVPPSLTPQTVFDGSDGFSAATSVLFELNEPPCKSTLPEHGGSSVLAFDLDTGKRIPIRVKLNKYASSRHVATPSHIIEIYPRSRWSYKGRYIVALTNDIKTVQKSDFSPTQGFIDATKNDGSTLSNYYEPSLRFLEHAGVHRNRLISATFFTIRSEQEVTLPMKTLSQFVYEQDHPIRKVRIKYPKTGVISAKIHGELLVHDYRNSDGGVNFKTATPKENWIRFRITLPHVSSDKKVPIAIYGHGLTASKRTDFLVSIMNAAIGVATISINHPNHGSRTRDDGGHVLTRLNTQHVPLQLGMMAQSPLDFMSLFKAVKTSIANLDIPQKPLSFNFLPCANFKPRHIPKIDTNKIFYQGTSLGGVLGSTFVALAPNLKGAFLHVSGVGITNILSNSALWSGVFSRLIPDGSTGAEAMVLKSAIQHELDYCDAINFVHYFRNPPHFSTAKPVAIAAGLDDGIVPNLSTVAMAEIAQLPMVGKILFAIPNVEKRSGYDEGYGVTQVTPPLKALRVVRGLLAHISFVQPEVYKKMRTWTREVIFD